jgi:hypothetical protein
LVEAAHDLQEVFFQHMHKSMDNGEDSFKCGKGLKLQEASARGEGQEIACGIARVLVDAPEVGG